MYRKYVFNDVQRIAPYYGVDFSGAHIPSLDKKNAFLSHLCTLNQHKLISDLPELSLKFWKGEFVGNSCSENIVQNILKEGNKKRDECNHYLGGIFHYGGENYWGVDRINLLLERLDNLGANKANSLRIHPAVSKSGANYNTSNVKLELFFSANSPYTYLSFDRVRKLGEKYNIPVVVRPIKPMLMRGMGISRRKGFYILSDCARIAEKLKIPFGKIRIATGLPLTRIYSLFPYVDRKGKGFDYLHRCMKGAYAEAQDISSKTFLRKVLIDLDLNPDEAFVHLDSKDWESGFEKNRLAMYRVNCWGAPTFKLFHKRKNILSTWGQDRIWLIEEELKKL
jgi:2-hydroxychromene-2-carboxylate isomerase